MEEIAFVKYTNGSSDYHYKQLRKNIFRFNAYLETRYKILLEILASALPDLKNNQSTIKLLDVGCGDGVLLFLLQKKYGNAIELYGVDSSKEALAIAQQKIPSAHLSQNEVYQTDFPNESFDIVLSSDVIEHVCHPEKMLAEIQRVAKKNGVIIVGTPIKFTESPLDPNHCQEFYQNDFLQLMSSYFSQCTLFESHSLLALLAYRISGSYFGKRLSIFKYLINVLHLCLGINVFRMKKPNSTALMSYMMICAINSHKSQNEKI